jgi:CCR4-NOT complex subunit CAF16
MADQAINKDLAPSIDVKNLSYKFPDGSNGLKEVFLDLPPGSRTLLIGGETSMQRRTDTRD